MQMLTNEEKNSVKEKSKGVSINKRNFNAVMSKMMNVILSGELTADDIRDIKILLKTKKIYMNNKDINFNQNEMDGLLNSIHTAFVKFVKRGI